jgi:hypothetical protein
MPFPQTLRSVVLSLAALGGLIAPGLDLPAAAEPRSAGGQYGSGTGARAWGEDGAIVERLRRIDQTLLQSSYSHVTRVNERAGVYDFDCSGLVAWVLARAAPGAYHSLRQRVGDRRLLARDFHRHIARIAPNRPHWA